MIKQILFVTLGFTILSCGKGRDSVSTDEISGAYVNEYAFKVINEEKGDVAGMRTIRDTIFIRPIDNGYEISNRKWKLNDYDKEGWQNVAHGEDRSMPTYQAIFERTDNSLKAQFRAPLYLNIVKRWLYKNKNSDSPYKRIE